MNTTYRNIIRAAAALALAATSAATFAQDGYYRAYGDAYDDSMRASYDRGDRGGWGRLHIEDAEYGLRGASCDARWGVRREIRNTGVVVAHNDLCGDPARGVQKRLRIIYRCGDSEPMRAFAREGETLRLRCGRGPDRDY
jgi:hypothetical protein